MQWFFYAELTVAILYDLFEFVKTAVCAELKLVIVYAFFTA